MIKKLRKKKGLTQSQLAKLCNLEQSYISELERYPSNCNPTLDTMINLAIALEIREVSLVVYFVEKRMERYGN